MKAFYTHCPHCGFPVVIHAMERSFLRRCRQCREEYLPGATLPGGASPSGRSNGTGRERMALRSRVHRQRRSVI